MDDYDSADDSTYVPPSQDESSEDWSSDEDSLNGGGGD